MMGYVNNDGELFMIDMSMHVYRTGLRRDALRDSLVDGEYVTQDSEKIQFLNLFYLIAILPQINWM